VIQRLGLLLGSVAAAAVMAVALAGAGLAPATETLPTAPPAASEQAQVNLDQGSPEPITQVDTVYVEPAPPPKTIRVVKAAPTKPPIVVHKVVQAPAAEAENDGEQSGEGD